MTDVPTLPPKLRLSSKARSKTTRKTKPAKGSGHGGLRIMAENTAANQRGPGRPFQRGVSGNPAGKPKGSKHKLQEDFVAALAKDFEANGAKAIEAVRTTEPAAYLAIIAKVLPKDVNVSHDVGADLIAALRRINERHHRSAVDGTAVN